MTAAEEYFHQVGAAVEGSIKSQLFGKPCYKLGSKAFICFFKEEMVFKLDGETHAAALSLDGAQLFDPSGKGRPMKAWVQVPYAYQDQWGGFATQAAALATT